MNIDFCFFHIEKCMGSSLRIIFYNYFKKIYKSKFINYKINLTNNFNDFKHFKVMLCHCAYNHQNVTSQFSKNCFSVTCVREPLSRFISHYYHFSYPKNNKKIHELTDTEMLYQLKINGSNLLTTRLSGNTDNYQTAIDNIKSINCILVMENINTDLIKLNKLLNKHFNKNYQLKLEHTNKNKINKNELDFLFLEKYHTHFENDINLYND